MIDLDKLRVTVIVESKKFFHSRVPLITLTAFIMIPFMGGFFMYILQDPTLAKEMGFISAKANIMGTADWPSYLNLLSQAIALGGLIVFGFVASWIFGREYADRTIKDLLALPVSRDIIVLSKYIVMFLWCAILSLFVICLGIVVGKLVDISCFSWVTVVQGVQVFFFCSILTILVSTPVGFIASIGRGYLSPLGFIIFTLILAQLVAAIGYGQFFPWSIPALFSGITGEDIYIAGNTSIIILLTTSLLGIISTILWWRYADQH